MSNQVWSKELIKEIETASNDGERVVSLYQNDCYYAHLSLYKFALPVVKKARVLDAGCGTGYGSIYLKKNGAKSVLGVDYAEDAIDYCKRKFKRWRLAFQQMDLSQPVELDDQSYDVIFSSNALEHVPNVQVFFDTANRLLKPDGTLIVAVPPLTSEAAREADLVNRYHLNNWSPEQWKHTLEKYFHEVTAYRHRFTRKDVKLDFLNLPDKCVITENDFECIPSSPQGMRDEGTLTALFTAKGPKSKSDIPSSSDPVEFIDESTSRPPATENEES